MRKLHVAAPQRRRRLVEQALALGIAGAGGAACCSPRQLARLGACRQLVGGGEAGSQFGVGGGAGMTKHALRPANQACQPDILHGWRAPLHCR